MGTHNGSNYHNKSSNDNRRSVADYFYFFGVFMSVKLTNHKTTDELDKSIK
jgi:hypothetical protein